MDKTVICHGSFQNGEQIFSDAVIVIRDGRIEAVRDGFDRDFPDACGSDVRVIDASGMWLSPAWVDSHLHIPGDILFQQHGLVFYGCSDVKAYEQRLVTAAKAFGPGQWIRGFGWSAPVMEEGGYESMWKFLRSQFAERPVLLFSDDYHSCICSPQALCEIRSAGIPVNPDEWGVVREKDIFLLTRDLPQMSFSEEEMESAVSIYQEKLLKLGITSVQTLMFLGGNGEREWKVLRRMDDEGRLKLKVNLALTVQPYEDLGKVEERFQRLRGFSSDHIAVRTVKIYIDGVVESATAFLKEPYEGTDDCGRSFWETDVLERFCTEMDRLGHQIHVHAIGDGAVHQAAEALKKAMDANDTAGRNRHVITHLQLADDADIRTMAQYGIIAAIQPYWFPQGPDYYGLELPFLGKRAETEYKAGTMEKMGVLVTGASDSPVTGRPDPLSGILMAARRYWKEERISVAGGVKAFTENGAYQLGRERELGRIREGFRADLIGISVPLKEETIEQAELCFVMADGEMVWTKKEH